MKKVHITLHEGKPVRVEFKCPGCSSTHSLPVRSPQTTGHSWIFTGNEECPTLEPSICATTGPFPENVSKKGILSEGKLNAARCLVCHSFVRQGRIEFLGDCTHDLKNKTVELPEYIK